MCGIIKGHKSATRLELNADELLDMAIRVYLFFFTFERGDHAFVVRRCTLYMRLPKGTREYPSFSVFFFIC